MSSAIFEGKTKSLRQILRALAPEMNIPNIYKIFCQLGFLGIFRKDLGLEKKIKKPPELHVFREF